MSEGRLEGKNVVVSGGAAGVGGAASEIFASEGAYVAIVDVQEKVGVNLAERISKTQGKAFFVKCDVSVSEEVENASDYPTVEDGKYKGVVGVGGLLLAKVPEEIAKQRQAYMTDRHKQRDEAVKNDLMKEQDQRMPINVDRQSRVTFGGTKK